MDPLLALKSAIQASSSLTLSSSKDFSDDTKLPDTSIGIAKYLHFPSSVPYFSSSGALSEPAASNGVSIELDTPTRYHTNNKTAPVSLKTVYDAWLTRDLKGPEYISQANEQNIQYLKIVERLDLVGWLKDESESENIKDIDTAQGTQTSDTMMTETALASDATSATTATATSTSTNGTNDTKTTNSHSDSQSSNTLNPLDVVTAVEETLPSKPPPHDPTVSQIYKNEHVFLDHNSALHGSKLIDFTSVGKDCRNLIINVVKGAQRSSQHQNQHHSHNQQRSGNGHHRQQQHPGRNPYDRNPNAPGSVPRPVGLLPRVGSSSSSASVNKGVGHSGYSSANSSSALASSQRGRSKDPIILLSPSTSALLNMGNVRSFLEDGEFIPRMAGLGAPDLIRLNRYSSRFGSKSGNPGERTKIHFVVVDNVEKFTKPEYWDRVVAVFVTGQAWQFKSYRWPTPNELFQHIAGFYLAFQGERVPPELGTWRNVTVTQIPKNERFRDREAAEVIWNQIEKWMLAKGWKF